MSKGLWAWPEVAQYTERYTPAQATTKAKLFSFKGVRSRSAQQGCPSGGNTWPVPTPPLPQAGVPQGFAIATGVERARPCGQLKK